MRPEPAPAPGPAPRKSSLGLVIGLLVGLLVLGGGGAAAYFLYFKDRLAGSDADGGAAPAADAGAVAAADAGAIAPPVEPDAGAAPEPADAGAVAPPEVDAGVAAPTADTGEAAGPDVGADATQVALVEGPPDAGAPEAADPGPPVPEPPKISEAARMQFQLGKELTARKKWTKAAEAFKKALKASPGYGDAHKALATCLVNIGDLEGAKKHFQRYLELAPADAPDREQIQSMVDSL